MNSDELLHRSGLSLERLHAFVLVADAGGIAAAFPGNPTRQSLASRQISDLEAALEQRLFDRRGRRLHLTPAGHRLAGLVRVLRSGLLDVAEASEAPRSLSVGAGDSLLHWWVIPRLARASLAPHTSFTSLAAREIPERLDDARLDFGLVRDPPPRAGLESRRLGEVRYALFAPRELARGGEALLDRAPLALQTSEPELHAPILDAARRLGGGREILWCETFPQVRRALDSGRYAGMLPSVARCELPPRFVEVPGLPTVSASVYLLWNTRVLAVRPGGDGLAAALARALALQP